MNYESFKLTDLLDLEYLQQLQDGFADATKVTTVIVDPDGNRITRPSNWRGLCSMYYDSESCHAECRKKTSALVEESRKAGKPIIAECPQGGLTTASVPIVVEGHFLGSWIFGQMLTKAPELSAMEEAAEKLNIPAAEVKKAIDALPRYSSDIFNSMFVLMQAITSTLVELGRKNMELVRQDEQLLDITKQLESRDQILTKYIEASGDAMYISDYETGNILIANEELCRLLEHTREEIVGKGCREVFEGNIPGFCSYCPQMNILNKCSDPNGPQSRIFFFRKREQWLRITNQVTAWGKSRQAQMVTIEDVTDEHSMREQLKKLAFYDTLTGLPNSNRLSADFPGFLEKYTSNERYILCFELSSLRLFNDAYGKDMGDEMLKIIVQWLREEYYVDSEVYHLGGYDFCLLPKLSVDLTFARTNAQKLNDRFEKPWQITTKGRDFSYVCGASVSILKLPPEIVSFEDLQNLIGRTMSNSKQMDAIYLYDEEMDRQNHEHIKLVMSLKECINREMEGFHVEYQPIVRLSTGMWTGVEALCRWSRPGAGAVSPLVFIREAESLGLINEIGTWVLDTAVRQAKEIGLHDVDNFFLSVNISPIQMMNPAFADTVAHILDKYRYPGSKLNLEVTESTKMTFSNFTMSMITRLRSLGVRLALDDFGTGYSSFNNLKNLPVDFLKTEREFIMGIEDDDYMQYFFYLMAEIAHTNKMKLIAEGIETAEQLKIVKNNGADYIQGYFFSKPITADKLKEKFERFHIPDLSFVTETAEVINIQHWLSGKSAYELTPALFNLMNQCMQVMLSETDVSTAFQGIFEILGEHFHVSRAFAFVQEEKGLYSNLYEWCGEKIAPQKHLLQKIPVLEDTPSLQATFKEHGMMIAPSIQVLPADMQVAFQGQDVMAVALIPMWDEADLLGFVGFDSIIEHAWSPEEIVMLWNLAILMANTIKKEKLKIEVVEKKSMLETLLQGSGLNAYATDVETMELLWINEAMRAGRDLEHHVIGKKCHEVLAHSAKPCDFCNMQDLLDNPHISRLTHEVYSTSTNQNYLAYSTLVQWPNGKTAFVHYSKAAADQLNTEKELEHLAATDMLTGAYNRSTIMLKFQEILKEAHDNNSLVSICFLDIDRLRDINCTHGQEQGDMVLFNTVQAIKSCIKRRDLVGRLLSDSFIVLMPDCAKGMARVRMLQARNALAKMDLLPDQEPVSFSFGIVENTELEYAESMKYYQNLLSIAEKRVEKNKIDGWNAEENR